MIQKLAYTCRLCGKPHVASYDDACGQLQLDKWLLVLCCDRCHDYHTGRRHVLQAIGTVCQTLLRESDKPGGLPPDVVATARWGLERLTKRLAWLCSNFLRLSMVWEADFVNQLVERPDKWRTVVRVYENGLRDMASRPAVTPSLPYADA